MVLLVSDQSTSLSWSVARGWSTSNEAMQRVTEAVGRADTDVRLPHLNLSDQVQIPVLTSEPWQRYKEKN